MVEALLRTWPVPEGHIGHVASEAPTKEVSLPELVAEGLIEPGSVLAPKRGSAEGVRIDDAGLIEYDGHVYETPSGAAWKILGHGVNGWTFWSLPDGRRLTDVRADYFRERERAD